MFYDFYLTFDQIPSDLLPELPLEDWSVEFDQPVDELEFEFNVEFNVESNYFTDNFGRIGNEEVVFEGLTVNDIEVPKEFWEKVIPEGTSDQILKDGPGEYLY